MLFPPRLSPWVQILMRQQNKAEATNAAIHGLDDSVKTVTDSIETQTKTVTDLGTQQSKVTKEISKALNTQNSRQKDANTTLAEQRKIMQEQETEIKKVTSTDRSSAEKCRWLENADDRLCHQICL